MGYFLQAFIGRQSDLESLSSRYHNASCVNLAQGIAIMPMTEDLYDEINQMTISEDISTFMYLTKNIEIQILSLIGVRKVGYIEAEYHGGQGGQTAIVWTDGQRTNLIEHEQGAINSVLKQFGVLTNTAKDEFESLNLGRHRHTKDWLTS